MQVGKVVNLCLGDIYFSENHLLLRVNGMEQYERVFDVKNGSSTA